MSASIEDVMQACRTGNSTVIEEIVESDLTRQTATPLLLSLENVTEMGNDVAASGPAAGWSMQETIIAAFGQQTDSLRTGAITGELLRSEHGILYRWNDPYMGTVCLMGLPEPVPPDAPAQSPVIRSDSIIWRAQPTGQNAQFTSQIIVISDRPN